MVLVTGATGRPGRPDIGTDARTVTVGVAIAVPEPYASALRAARRRFGDPRADSIRTHITVAGPRAVPARDVPAIGDHLAAVAAATRAYDVTLAGTGTFRPVTDVVYLRVTDGAAECARLAALTCAGPLALDSAFPYHPHVTLAHDVSAERLDAAAAELADFRLTFAVSSVGLYECGSDDVWRPTRSFPLAGRA